MCEPGDEAQSNVKHSRVKSSITYLLERLYDVYYGCNPWCCSQENEAELQPMTTHEYMYVVDNNHPLFLCKIRQISHTSQSNLESST